MICAHAYSHTDTEGKGGQGSLCSPPLPAAALLPTFLPKETTNPAAAPCCVQGLPNWSSTMDSWGGQLLAAVTAVAQMAALGFGLPSADAFSRLMKGGPHLLAPTGSDLVKHGAVGTVLAGFHYDLNFITVGVDVCVYGRQFVFFWGGGRERVFEEGSRSQLSFGCRQGWLPMEGGWRCKGGKLRGGARRTDPTHTSCMCVDTLPLHCPTAADCCCSCCWLQIHGKSRFPGLSVWLADGTCSPVSIPEGCLLCQVRYPGGGGD